MEHAKLIMEALDCLIDNKASLELSLLVHPWVVAEGVAVVLHVVLDQINNQLQINGDLHKITARQVLGELRWAVDGWVTVAVCHLLLLHLALKALPLVHNNSSSRNLTCNNGWVDLLNGADGTPKAHLHHLEWLRHPFRALHLLLPFLRHPEVLLLYQAYLLQDITIGDSNLLNLHTELMESLRLLQVNRSSNLHLFPQVVTCQT